MVHWEWLLITYFAGAASGMAVFSAIVLILGQKVKT